MSTQPPSHAAALLERPAPQAVFRAYYDALAAQIRAGAPPRKASVLQFYGASGVGKTCLLRLLAGDIAARNAEAGAPPIPCALVDFESPDVAPDAYGVLSALRNALQRNQGFAFPLFDLAAARHEGLFARACGNAPPCSTSAFWKEAGLDTAALRNADCADRIGGALRAWLDRRGKADMAEACIARFTRLASAQTLAQLEPLLPQAFALDLRANLDADAPPTVILFDGYGADCPQPAPDAWLHGHDGLLGALPEVAWVFAGRAPLAWDRAWPLHPVATQAHCLGGYAKAESAALLRRNGMAGLRRDLRVLTGGLPLWLDVCTEIHRLCLARGKEIRMKRFGADLDEGARRYRRLVDEDTGSLLDLLACLRVWTDAQLASVAAAAGIALRPKAYAALLQAPFIRAVDGARCLHAGIAEPLRAGLDPEKRAALDAAVCAHDLALLKSTPLQAGWAQLAFGRYLVHATESAQGAEGLQALYEAVRPTLDALRDGRLLPALYAAYGRLLACLHTHPPYAYPALEGRLCLDFAGAMDAVHDDPEAVLPQALQAHGLLLAADTAGPTDTRTLQALLLCTRLLGQTDRPGRALALLTAAEALPLAQADKERVQAAADALRSRLAGPLTPQAAALRRYRDACRPSWDADADLSRYIEAARDLIRAAQAADDSEEAIRVAEDILTLADSRDLPWGEALLDIGVRLLDLYEKNGHADVARSLAKALYAQAGACYGSQDGRTRLHRLTLLSMDPDLRAETHVDEALDGDIDSLSAPGLAAVRRLTLDGAAGDGPPDAAHLEGLLDVAADALRYHSPLAPVAIPLASLYALLGATHSHAHDHQAAILWLTKARDLLLAHWGGDAVRALQATRMLANAHRRAGDTQEALSLLTALHAAVAAQKGADHPDAQALLEDLDDVRDAESPCDDDPMDDDLPLWDDDDDEDEDEAPDDDDYDTVYARIRRLWAHRKYAEAAGLLEALLADLRLSLSDDSPRLLLLENDLACMLHLTHATRAAQAMLSGVAERSAVVWQAGHPFAMNVQNNLAAVALALSEPGAAIPCLARLHRQLARAYGMRHEEAARIRRLLEAACAQAGKPLPDLSAEAAPPPLSLSKKARVRAEQAYDILQNDEGELLFTLEAAYPGPPSDRPTIHWDGLTPHALLHRAKGQYVLLDFLHPGVHQPLALQAEALVAEHGPGEDGRITAEYRCALDITAAARPLLLAAIARLPGDSPFHSLPPPPAVRLHMYTLTLP